MRAKVVFWVCAAVLASAAPVMAQPRPAEADFQSTGQRQWEVLVDQQPACVTPCRLTVQPGRWLSMRTLERRPVRVEVGMLDGPALVQAKPLAGGAHTTGIVFTALGGTAFVTGVALGSVGCFSDDREGLCTAGLITGGVGAVVTAGSIWLMKRSVPRVYVHRRTVGIAGNF
jgi:hypothetical protein